MSWRGSAAACVLVFGVRISPGHGSFSVANFVCCAGRGFDDGLITRLEESHCVLSGVCV